MDLPLANGLKIGLMTSFPNKQESRAQIETLESLGYDSAWVGDHIAFPVPILDSLSQLAYAAALTDKLTLGTCVYLLPLRHPTPVAKQVATIDRLAEGRLIFGVGIGGEFPNEYASCGIPVKERGPRLGESMEVLKALWQGEPADYEGQFFLLNQVNMQPTPMQAGGPPMWCGGRSEAALKRTGRLADGWVSYAITPAMFRDGMQTIAQSAQQHQRDIQQFGTGHLLFMRLDKSYDEAWDKATEHLSRRYGMDFRKAAQRYAALGSPSDVAERISEYFEAGVRHIMLDLTGPAADRDEQTQQFAEEVMPLISGLGA
ncbi:MAG: LLM class flavin-dependent oxidoreductase [Pseudomonadota bacterium]